MNKFTKSKVVGIAAASLAAVAVASVGFSAWIISDINNKEISNIEVDVGTVLDQSISIADAKIVWPAENTKKQIVFDADSTLTDSGAGKVFKASEGSKEYLNFGISLKITLGQNVENFNGISAWMSVDAGEADIVTDKITNADGKCVVSPIVLGTNSSETWEAPATKTDLFAKDVASAGDSNKEISKSDLKFGWGKAFNSLNPVMLDNKENVPTYKSNLEKMKGLKFTIHLEVKTTA